MTQVIEPNFARCVFALEGEHTRLEGEQTQGRQGRAALGTVRGIHPLAAFRHQAGGHIHAQQRRVCLAQKMQVLLQPACRWAGMAQTQQGVDAQIPFLGGLGMDGDARFFHLVHSVQGVSGWVIAWAQGEPNAFAQGMQIQGGMQTVTAIVARPASDPNALGMWRPGHGHLGHFFTITKNAKFGFASEHLFSTDQAGLTAFEGDAIIVQYFLHKGFFTDFCGFLGYLLHATAKIGKFELALFISHWVIDALSVLTLSVHACL
jgi:hypothetical protein